MKVQVINEEKMYELCDLAYNPPDIRGELDEQLFQIEIKQRWNSLVHALSYLGEEGDYGDYSLAPFLRDYRTVIPRAPRSRSFFVLINSNGFFDNEYLEVIHQFLTNHRNPSYLIEVDKGFEPEWMFKVFITSEVAQIYCSDDERLHHFVRTLSKL
jgi:hypothetical protein